MTKRNAAVELFRCLLMALIVADHCYCYGPWYCTTEAWGLCFTTFIHWHVDAFIAISGWFGIKFSISKFIRIWGLMMFYTMVDTVLILLWRPDCFSFSHVFSLGGWFGGCYLALMLMAPFLNAGVSALCARSRREAILAGAGIAAVVALTWLPGHLLTGVNANGSHQYSFLNMMGIYVVVRLIRELDLGKVGLKTLALGPVIFLLGILLIGGSKSLLQVYRGLPSCAATWDFLAFYDAPHYWIMAVSMLLIFALHVRIPERVGRVALFLAPSMFPIYLIHTTTHFGRKAIWLVESHLPSGHPVCGILLTALVVFVGCALLDLLRRLLMAGGSVVFVIMLRRFAPRLSDLVFGGRTR